MKANAETTFEITKSLFALLEYERPEISFCGIHVLFLTESFYEHLPFRIKRRMDYDQLRYGALLHDIGKISVPKEILTKPGKLKKEEMELMKDHAQASAKILGGIPGLAKLSTWIQYHHERIDGKGYFHLQGKEIPLEAKIIAITDAYSSIIMASSYKPSRTHEDALSILNMGAGTQFDEELIGLFCAIPPKHFENATEKAVKMMGNIRKVFMDCTRENS